MFLPAKRKREKMGVREPEQRTFPTHQAFVRRHSCCVPGCQDGPIQFAHVKTRGSGGGDEFGVSMCAAHHAEQHQIGIFTFQKKYGLDLWKMAEEFARRTTDRALREMLKERK